MNARLFAPIALALASVIALAGPATAHDETTGSNPEPGQILTAAPESVSVTFSEPPIDMGNELAVLDNNGTNWVDGPTTVSENTVSAALLPDMPNGVYSLNWRVVASDGHPVSSAIAFAIGDTEAIREELAVAMAAHGLLTDEPVATDAPADESATDIATVTAYTDDSATDPVPLVVAGVAAVALLVGGVALLRRGRRAATPTEGSEQ